MAKKVYNYKFAGRQLTIETGELARQAGGSVLVRYGDTVVLTTATASKHAKNIDFFPLTVVYEEKLYSVGKIPGGFLRREGRPSENATLTSRLIDRTIRPLFPEGFRNEVQVVCTVLSVDYDHSPSVAAMLGASLALSISDIPFNGPIAGVEIGLVDGEFKVNPSAEEYLVTDMELVVAGTYDAINMVEAGANEVSEQTFLDAMALAHENIQVLCGLQKDITTEVGKEKRHIDLFSLPTELVESVEKLVGKEIRAAVSIIEKLSRYEAIDAAEAIVMEHYEDLEYESDFERSQTLKYVHQITQDIVSDEVRRLISVEKIRPDGRKIDQVRQLDVQMDLLNRVHGSGLFTRGETQVLSIATLGAMGDTQIIDDLSSTETKRFMHHYNFPPYSVGETGRMGAPGRREIGHGALGERALSYVLPSEEEFPYAIRLVSEVLESNGSSSQASICASSIALMAAGVPIKAAVSGIAMGLVKYGDDYTVLTDIQGLEDHFGDMDFKVAGTDKGITALQMDIKISGLSQDILKEALEQARLGRAHIMKAMNKVIDKPREDVAQYAPKTATTKIAVNKIRDVIGAGGKIINQIIEDSNNVKIDIDDEGRVVIYHTDRDSINHALSLIENIVREAKVGEIFDAKVMRIEKFGAFVQLFAGTDALVHVSQLDHKRVENVEDVLKLGQIIQVKVMEIDDRGRVNASRKVLIPEPVKEETPSTEDK